MSGLLKSNQLSVIKRTIGDFIIYNVKTEEQINVLTKLLEEQSELVKNGNAENVKIDLGLNMIKDLLRHFTNISDELDEISDDELQQLINNGNGDLKDTIYEVMNILNDFTKDYYKNLQLNLSMMDSRLESLQIELLAEEIKKKLGLQGISNEELQKVLLEKAEQEKKAKIKKPQDHKTKKPRTPKKKKETKVVEVKDGEVL